MDWLLVVQKNLGHSVWKVFIKSHSQFTNITSEASFKLLSFWSILFSFWFIFFSFWSILPSFWVTLPSHFDPFYFQFDSFYSHFNPFSLILIPFTLSLIHFTVYTLNWCLLRIIMKHQKLHLLNVLPKKTFFIDFQNTVIWCSKCQKWALGCCKKEWKMESLDLDNFVCVPKFFQSV